MRCTCLLTLNVCLIAAASAQSIPGPVADDPKIQQALAFQRQGQFALAEEQYEQAIRETSGEISLKAGHILNLASIYYHELGKYPQAEYTLRKSLAVWEKLLGSDNIALSRILNRLACVYVESGQTGKAERLNLAAWEERLEAADPLSQDHLNLLGTMSLMAAQKGDLDEAQKLNMKAYDIAVRKGEGESLDAVALLNHLGLINITYKRPTDATDALLKARKILQNIGEENTFHGAVNSALLARIYVHQKKYEEAAPLVQQALAFVERNCGKQSIRTAELLNEYSIVLRNLNRKKEAEQLAERAKSIVGQSAVAAFTANQVDVSELARR